MKRFLSLSVVMVLVLAMLALAGCGGDKKEAASQQPSGKEAPKTSGEEKLADIFAKGKKVEGMSYDFTMTSKETKLSGKFWIQGSKMKTEMMAEGKKMITIFDGNTIYNYIPDQNMAMKMTPDKAKKNQTPLDYANDAESKGDKVKVLETTVYEGVKCKVVSIASADGKEQTKMWIREDYGIPVRVESTEPGGEKTVLEYKNLKVGPQPADTFNLPAGVQVQDLSEMMKQIPQMPGGKQP